MNLAINELKRNKTSYNVYRQKLGVEYISYIKSRTSGINTEREFFSPASLENFISSRPNKNKRLIVTHISEFVKMVDGFMCTDIRQPGIEKSYSLKFNPRFKKFLPEKKTRSQSTEKFVYFNASCLEKLLDIHSRSDHSQDNLDSCRLLFIALVGCRPESTIDLKSNSSITKKLCNRCVSSQTCRYFTPDCFPQVHIHKTKTSASHSAPLLTAVFPCYQALKDLPANVFQFKERHMNSLNEFSVANFGMTAHKARKFLPNLLTSNISNSNTGAWSNDQTLRRFYLSPMYKFLLAEKLVVDYLAS